MKSSFENIERPAEDKEDADNSGLQTALID